MAAPSLTVHTAALGRPFSQSTCTGCGSSGVEQTPPGKRLGRQHGAMESRHVSSRRPFAFFASASLSSMPNCASLHCGCSPPPPPPSPSFITTSSCCSLSCSSSYGPTSPACWSRGSVAAEHAAGLRRGMQREPEAMKMIQRESYVGESTGRVNSRRKWVGVNTKEDYNRGMRGMSTLVRCAGNEEGAGSQGEASDRGDGSSTSSASPPSPGTSTTSTTTTTTVTTVVTTVETRPDGDQSPEAVDKQSADIPQQLLPSPLGDASAPNAVEKLRLDAFSVMELLGPEKVDGEDVKILKEKMFGYTTYWVTKQEPYGDFGEGVLLIGNLRGKREEVYEKLQKSLKELMGDKYDLFMIEEPNAESSDPRGGPRVSFVLLRKEVSQAGPPTFWQYLVAVGLAALTAGACLELGLASQVSKLPLDVVQYFASPDPQNLTAPDVSVLTPYIDQALPVAYSVFGVQLVHEVGHWVAALSRKVRLGIPYLIPNITIGSFGSVTQFASVCPDRTAKFDVSVAGPLAGGVLSLGIFAFGLALTVDPSNADELIQVPSLLFQGSLALGVVSRFILGFEAVHAPFVAIHPLVVAGWCGLTTTALNMLPVGCLDGGRAMQAAFGRGPLQISSITTYVLLGLGVLGGTLSLPWGLYVLIVQRAQEKVSLNDVTEVGPLRQGALLFLLTVSALILLPVLPQIASDLGIGVTQLDPFNM